MAECAQDGKYGDGLMFDLDVGDGVVVVARRLDEPAELHPAEAVLLSDRAVDSRRIDFSAGRTAARVALARLGGTDAGPVGRGSAGEPEWPAGVVGSITHAAGWALVVAASQERSGGIGVDLEAASRYFPELGAEIAFGEERDRLAALDPAGLERAAVEMFAVKEAIYKAFYPRVRIFFGFDAVMVSPSAGGYVATFREELDTHYLPGDEFPVRVRWFEDLVVAWLVLPPD